MIEFALTAAIFLALFAAMAIGVLAGRKPISGSCGGLSSDKASCSICGGGREVRACPETSQENGKTVPGAGRERAGESTFSRTSHVVDPFNDPFNDQFGSAPPPA